MSLNDHRIALVIPALNEVAVIAHVVKSLPEWLDAVIVVDGGSSDGTGDAARAAGAVVVRATPPGYGRSCLAGIAEAKARFAPDIIVFMDGDGADDPADLPALLAPILKGGADFVIGSRLLGKTDRGALTLAQRLGNRLACSLMRVIWNGRYTDLGPFRAIRQEALDRLHMGDETFGWTVEMQVRALKASLRTCEVPVHYRKRVGVSKISGTLYGIVLAGHGILGTIWREARSNISYRLDR